MNAVPDRARARRRRWGRRAAVLAALVVGLNQLATSRRPRVGDWADAVKIDD